jgi:hypothetical protein
MTGAVIGGLFGVLAFILSQITFFLTSRKRKTEDMANLIIPRRAELYREFFCAVGKTGVQMLKDEGDMPEGEKISLLHDICNRAMYELCPYGSLAFLECIAALSKICYQHKPGVLAGEEGAWKAFKNSFMFKFLEMPALARSDCFGPDFDRFLKRGKAKAVRVKLNKDKAKEGKK